MNAGNELMDRESTIGNGLRRVAFLSTIYGGTYVISAIVLS